MKITRLKGIFKLKGKGKLVTGAKKGVKKLEEESKKKGTGKRRKSKRKTRVRKSVKTKPLKGKEVYGPHYDTAVRLHKENPEYFPNPDKSRIVQGKELKAKRKEYNSKVARGELERGHHVQALGMGGDNKRNNITHTGESTIKRSQLTQEQQERYYNEGYTNKKNYKKAKIKEDPNGDIIVDGKKYSFGLNQSHTEATTFQNKVYSWQREVGLRTE